MGPMSSTDTHANPARTTLLLGVSTVVAQALLLREAMAAMGGSETAWGMVMALWLGGMAVGARLGVHVGSSGVVHWLPAATLALCGTGILLFRAAPVLLAVAPGETLTTWRAVWLWAAAVIPAAAVGGMAFPILADDLGDHGPGRAYTLDAIGSLTGGLVLSLVLLPFGTAAALAITVAAVAAGALWPGRRGLAIASVAVGLVLAALAGPWLAHSSWRWAAHPGELGGWAETRHQRLESSAGRPTDLYANGRLVATYPEPYATLPRAHLMMLLHPAPRRVLAVGCAADGSLEAMVRHPVSEVIVVEEDPQLIGRLEDWYGPEFRRILHDPKIATRTADPVRVLADLRDLDLVLLTDADPTTLRANRTRTLEFLRRCRAAMSDHGVLVMEVGVSDTYLGGIAGELVATLASTLRLVFPRVTALPGERILLIAGAERADVDLSLETLNQRRLDRPEIGDQLHPALLPLLIDDDRRVELADFVERVERPPDTIRHPRAVHLASRLHEARSRLSIPPLLSTIEDRVPAALGSLYAIVVAAMLAAALCRRAGVRAAAAASAVGLVSLGWWLILLATWQATRGSVYAEVGALTGAFMAGVALGGRLGLRLVDPPKALPWLLAAGSGVSFLLASSLAIRAPMLSVPALLLVGGGLTGAAFPSLAELAGSRRRGAGIAFAADEAGAALAALTIGTLAVPWLGLTTTALALAGLGLAAIPAAARR